MRIVGVRFLELFFQKAKIKLLNDKKYFFNLNLQLVCLLGADGLESVDEVSDDLHPELLGLLVLSHQVDLLQLCCRLENDGEDSIFVKLLYPQPW